MYLSPVQSLPIKPCRQRRHFSPQMRVSRFVFLSRPPLSLEVHLGVTASPQTPFPMDFVTALIVQRVTAISAHSSASPDEVRPRD